MQILIKLFCFGFHYISRRYDNVSLMACAALTNVLGRENAAVRSIVKQYSMHELDEPVVDENIFRDGTVSLIIRSCAEATNVLCKVSLLSNNPQCDPINERLWDNLFGIINNVKNIDSLFVVLECVHKMLLIDNVRDLLERYQVLNSLFHCFFFFVFFVKQLCSYKSKLVESGLDIIKKLATDTFIFNSLDAAADAEAFNFIMDKRLRLIKTINRVLADAPYPNECSNSIIDSILTIPATIEFDPNTFLLHCQGLIGDMFNGNGAENVYLVKLRVWTKTTSEIAAWIVKHSSQIKTLPAATLNEISYIVFRHLYAPILAPNNTATPVRIYLIGSNSLTE